MDKFTQKLEELTKKWLDIEEKDFLKYVPYELSREEFNKEIEEHDLHAWLIMKCKLTGISEDCFKMILWEKYTGKSIWDKTMDKIHKKN